MNPANATLRRTIGLLACVLVLIGTTGAAAMHEFVHARQDAGSQDRSGGVPEPGTQDCVLCVMAGMPAIGPPTPAHSPGLELTSAGDALASCTDTVHTASSYLTPPGRAPPAI